jgi:hypothetical protein
MNSKVHWPARLLLATMVLVSVFGFAGLAAASGEAQDTGSGSLTAANLDDLLARFSAQAELTIPVRSERYVGAAEVSRYLARDLSQGRAYTLVRGERSQEGFTAVVEVSDRGVPWARLTLRATLAGATVTRLEVAEVRLHLWPG